MLNNLPSAPPSENAEVKQKPKKRKRKKVEPIDELEKQYEEKKAKLGNESGETVGYQ